MSDPPPDANAPWPASLNLPPLARVDLDDLLHEVLERVGEVVTSRERLRALLDAVVAIGADLDLRSTLQRRNTKKRLFVFVADWLLKRFPSTGIRPSTGMRDSAPVSVSTSKPPITTV